MVLFPVVHLLVVIISAFWGEVPQVCRTHYGGDSLSLIWIRIFHFVILLLKFLNLDLIHLPVHSLLRPSDFIVFFLTLGTDSIKFSPRDHAK